MSKYSKGVFYERELLHFLNGKGFAVSRSPSSGGFMTPGDVIALKKGLILSFEIKAWSRKPRLERDKLEKFREWCDKAGAMGFLAWRKRKKWMFLRIEDADKGNYSDENWLGLESLLSALDFR